MVERVVFDKIRRIDVIDILVITLDIVICAALPFYQKAVFHGTLFNHTPALPFPVLVTGVQMLICGAFLLLGWLFYMLTFVKGTFKASVKPFTHIIDTFSCLCLPAFVFAVQIGLDNVSLVSLDVYLHSLLRLVACLSIPFFSFVLNKVTDSNWLILTAVLLFSGIFSLLGVAISNNIGHDSGDSSFNFIISVVFSILSATITGFYIALIQKMLRKVRQFRVANESIHPLEVAFYINFLSGVFLVCAATFFPGEGKVAFEAVFTPQKGTSGTTFLLLLLGGLLTSIFKVCGCVLAQRNPSITTAAVLIAKTTLQTVISLIQSHLWRWDMLLCIFTIVLGMLHYISLRAGWWTKSASTSCVEGTDSDENVIKGVLDD